MARVLHAANKKIKSPWGEFQKWVDENASSVRVGFELKLEVDRVEPNDYKVFLDFSRGTDMLSKIQIEMTLK